MAAPAHRPKNWLLIKIREWHTWGGVFLSGFIVLVCATGIYLNHKDLFFGEDKDHRSGQLSTTSDLSVVPVSFADALKAGKEAFGDGPLEKIELKDEKGTLVYKVKAGPGQEIIVNASTGEVTSKGGYKTANAGYNWNKIIDDLHTGKIAGTTGKLVVDTTSIVIIVLTVTGIYLWWVPIHRKRKSAREAAEKQKALERERELAACP